MWRKYTPPSPRTALAVLATSIICAQAKSPGVVALVTKTHWIRYLFHTVNHGPTPKVAAFASAGHLTAYIYV